MRFTQRIFLVVPTVNEIKNTLKDKSDFRDQIYHMSCTRMASIEYLSKHNRLTYNGKVVINDTS